MKFKVRKKVTQQPTQLDLLGKELELLLDDYALPRWAYTRSEWSKFVFKRRKLLDKIEDERLKE